MKRLFLLSAFVASTLLAAQAQTARRFTLINSSDSLSKMEVFLPEHPSGRAIVDLPGGGYSHLAMNHEGYDWAPYFNEKGIAYVVLTYRMPKGDRTLPLSDAYRAIRTVRDSAAAWQINPYDVGIMGFSAGGHLASSVSTHAPWEARPNFSILFYPVVSMKEAESHSGSVHNFLGAGWQDKQLVAEWSNFNRVQSHLTPPAIIMLANDDRTVPPVTNGVAYYNAMRRAGNDCSLVVYPSGGHGFGFRSSFAFHELMLQELSAWLQHIKAPKADAVRVACIGNSITDGFGIDMRSALSYPASLQRLLSKCDSTKNYNVKNFGVSARTLLNKGNLPYMKEEAWRDAQCFNPNIVVVKLGTNDSKPENWQHAADFQSDLKAMIDTLKALPSHPRVLLATPIPVLLTTTSKSWGIRDSVITAGIIPIIKKVAKKEKVELLDLHSLFPANDKDMMQRDGIHPTAKGASRLAEIVAEAICKSHYASR